MASEMGTFSEMRQQNGTIMSDFYGTHFIDNFFYGTHFIDNFPPTIQIQPLLFLAATQFMTTRLLEIFAVVACAKFGSNDWVTIWLKAG